MLKTPLLAAAAILAIGFSASAAAAQDIARQAAVADLQEAAHDLGRPARAEMDVENSETAVANGVEAQGGTVQPDAAPFVQTAAARAAILGHEPQPQEQSALRNAAQALGPDLP